MHLYAGRNKEIMGLLAAEARRAFSTVHVNDNRAKGLILASRTIPVCHYMLLIPYFCVRVRMTPKHLPVPVFLYALPVYWFIRIFLWMHFCLPDRAHNVPAYIRPHFPASARGRVCETGLCVDSSAATTSACIFTCLYTEWVTVNRPFIVTLCSWSFREGIYRKIA